MQVESKIEPWFKPKNGGVIPAKKRLIKRMMFECIVQWISSLFDSHSHSTHHSCFGGSQSEKPCCCFEDKVLTPTKSNAKKSKDIFPFPTQHHNAPTSSNLFLFFLFLFFRSITIVHICPCYTCTNSVLNKIKYEVCLSIFPFPFPMMLHFICAYNLVYFSDSLRIVLYFFGFLIAGELQ